MLGLIIFGTRGVTYGSSGGEFFCPDCGGPQPYRHRRVRRFFTLYFIPLIPLDLLGEYVECARCQATYQLGILDYDPAREQRREEAAFRTAARRVLVLMMLADGQVDDAEIVTIAEALGELERRPVARDEIELEVHAAQAERATVEAYCKTMAGLLNDAGREAVVKAAYRVATADGEFHASEQELLARIAGALNMSRAHFAGVLATAKAAA